LLGLRPIPAGARYDAQPRQDFRNFGAIAEFPRDREPVHVGLLRGGKIRIVELSIATNPPRLADAGSVADLVAPGTGFGKNRGRIRVTERLHGAALQQTGPGVQISRPPRGGFLSGAMRILSRPRKVGDAAG
jgi:hypothetical protein